MHRIPEMESAIHIHSKEDVERVRSELVHFIFGQMPENIPVSQEGDRLLFEGPYEMRFEARRYHDEENSKVCIYCEGHAGHYGYSLEAIQAFLSHGWDVIAMSMPLLGPNSQGKHEDRVLQCHEDFQCTPRPIEPFMLPWKALLDWAVPLYGNISICGVSGGGWSAALYAALDPRIQASYPVAGVWPFVLREPGEVGDFEQRWPPLYKIAGYMDLFLLGAAGRKQIQIFNRYDPACFGGYEAVLYLPLVRRGMADIGMGGEFDVLFDETHKDHKCSKWAVERICLGGLQ